MMSNVDVVLDNEGPYTSPRNCEIVHLPCYETETTVRSTLDFDLMMIH